MCMTHLNCIECRPPNRTKVPCTEIPSNTQDLHFDANVVFNTHRLVNLPCNMTRWYGRIYDKSLMNRTQNYYFGYCYYHYYCHSLLLLLLLLLLYHHLCYSFKHHYYHLPCLSLLLLCLFSQSFNHIHYQYNNYQYQYHNYGNCDYCNFMTIILLKINTWMISNNKANRIRKKILRRFRYLRCKDFKNWQF